jgi:hypothetical protein
MNRYLLSLQSVREYLGVRLSLDAPKLIQKIKKSTNLTAMIVNKLLSLLPAYQSSPGAQSLATTLTSQRATLCKQYFINSSKIAQTTEPEKWWPISPIRIIY